MPMPNFHSARVKNPDLFKDGEDDWGTQELAPGLNRIAGKLKSNNKWETQAYQFDKFKFTPQQAKNWLKDHDIKYTSFEPATEKKEMTMEEIKENLQRNKETYEITKDIFSVGVHNGDEYTDKDLRELEKNFNDLKNKVKVPLKIDLFKDEAIKDERTRHGGMPAVGWITELKKVGKKLYAHIENIPKKIKELIDKKAYRQVSAEIVWNFKNGDDRLNRVLTGVALLGVELPGVTNLDDFGAFYTKDYDEEEIVKLYEYDSDEEIRDVKKIVKKEDKKMDEQIVKQFEDKLIKKDEEIKQYKEKLAEVEKQKKEAEEKISKIEVDNFVKKYSSEGKLLPAHTSVITTLLSNMDASRIVKFKLTDKEEDVSVVKLFETFISSLPKLVDITEKSQDADSDLKTFKAKSVEEAGNEDAQKLDFLVKQYIEEHKDDKEICYEKALKEVSKKHPELVGSKK